MPRGAVYVHAVHVTRGTHGLYMFFIAMTTCAVLHERRQGCGRNAHPSTRFSHQPIHATAEFGVVPEIIKAVEDLDWWCVV